MAAIYSYGNTAGRRQTLINSQFTSKKLLRTPLYLFDLLCIFTAAWPPSSAELLVILQTTESYREPLGMHMTQVSWRLQFSPIL